MAEHNPNGMTWKLTLRPARIEKHFTNLATKAQFKSSRPNLSSAVKPKPPE
jgi:hypothetical protein